MRHKIILVLIVLFAMNGYSSFAENIEGTGTYRDYIFVLVHGMNDDATVFTGGKSFGNLKAYLENNLGLTGRVFCYSFSNNRGDNFLLARELGDRLYNINYSFAGGCGGQISMDGKCWLDKARADFLADKRNAGKSIPSKYILLTHSMGSYAARAYIYSDQLYDKGFYRNDVSKVVFIAPPLLGSDMALFAYKGYFMALRDGPGDISEGAKWTSNAAQTISDYFAGKKGAGDFTSTMCDILTQGNTNPYYPYQLSLDIAAKGIYRLTDDFPKSELFGLTSQVRRVAISIPSNIAEGFARQHTREFIQFLHVSLGSAAELETQLIISKELGYLKGEREEGVFSVLKEAQKMLNGLMVSLGQRASVR